MAAQTVVETTSMEAPKEQILVSVTLLNVQRWSLSACPVILIDAACAAYQVGMRTPNSDDPITRV
jgi:hypothetical protein